MLNDDQIDVLSGAMIPLFDELEHDPIYTETDVITITWT